MKEENIKGSAVDWFASVYQADTIECFGGYFGDYRIYDDKLILTININDNEGPARIEMFEIPAIIKLYKKYRKYTDKHYSYVSFKSEYDWEKEQFFEEINQV